MKKLLSIKEFAELTGQCKATVYGLIRSGVLPAYRPGKLKIYIRHEDYLAFIEKGKLS